MQKLTPIKAIRKKCLDRCCGSAHEVRRCPVENFALHPYRLGKNPNRMGMVNKGSFEVKDHGSAHHGAVNKK